MAAHPGPDCVEVYLGDYVDRGAQSAGVLDALLKRRKDRKAVCISGNHEAVMLDSLMSQVLLPLVAHGRPRDGVLLYSSRCRARRGAVVERMAQRGPGRTHFVPAPAFQLFVCGDYVFVHAGLRPGVPSRSRRAKT